LPAFAGNLQQEFDSVTTASVAIRRDFATDHSKARDIALFWNAFEDRIRSQQLDLPLRASSFG
jgi:hypothetical protein